MATTKTTTTKKTTTKPAAKKAVTKKAATKTTTAKKTTVKKTTTGAAELTVSGNKKFPYLHLCIAYSYARKDVAVGGTIYQIPGDKTLAQVRRADSGGTISISGNKKIKSLEKEFDTVFGLYCQVCYTSSNGKGYYTSGSSDDMTLSAFNALCEKNGCKKGVWK